MSAQDSSRQSFFRLPFLLAILDGVGLNPDERGNAVFHARKPVLEKLFRAPSFTTLTTFGRRVGLPDGQMGNSEVGHLNIGAGRIVQQDLTRIDCAVADRTFGSIDAFRSLCTELAARKSAALHCIGLSSRGGVHSSLDHLVELVRTAAEAGVRQIFVHALTDGRDRPPHASVEELGALLPQLEAAVSGTPGAICRVVSLCGRYYAMDRDNRWERTELAFNMLTRSDGERFQDPLALIRSRHAAGETDEFLKPAVLAPDLLPRPATVQDGDAIVFTNFRADRMRQIVACFTPDGKPGFERSCRPKLSRIATLTEYEKGLPVDVLFPPQLVAHHLGAVVSEAGLSQLRIAETEKYAHVTYFFNGGVEEVCRGEERILVPSPRDVATYDLKPEMSARGVTEKLLGALGRPTPPDFIVLNFANGDMVGHTGNFDAAVKAVETVDTCLGTILDALTQRGGTALITADHGNADQMIDYETGSPHTYHTKYPVPCVLAGAQVGDLRLASDGALCDIAPTICRLIGLPVPAEMTGRSLLADG